MNQLNGLFINQFLLAAENAALNPHQRLSAESVILASRVLSCETLNLQPNSIQQTSHFKFDYKR